MSSKTNRKFDFILERLPYSEPFLFVDEINSVSEEGIAGTYTFPPDSYFYAGHFKDHPVTPGVILTECMAQIGVVSLGIFLLKNSGSLETNDLKIAMSESNITYLLPVCPGEKVNVVSEKTYFRFGKLKCKVKMLNAKNESVCEGVISGMVVAY